ncbi:MAG: TetR/AcrR family transcriptional regulator [Patulibacter sp.]
MATTGRQEELLTQITEMFLKEGFYDLTLDDLTRRLRCSKTTLYVLGGNKDQLVTAIVIRFFREATEFIEARTAEVQGGPVERISAYVSAVGEALHRASPAFMDDISRHYVASAIYERNADFVSTRVSELIAEGVESGDFRPVHAAFVADLLGMAIERIQSGHVRETTGLQDAEAFDELSKLLLHAITP